MKGWTQYTSADEFAADGTFRNWVASGTYGQKGHPFTRFLAGHAHLIPLADQAADLLRVTAFPDKKLTGNELKAQMDGTWEKIRLRENTGSFSGNPQRRLWFRWAAAAVLAIAGGLALLEYQKTTVPPGISANLSEHPDSWQVVTNQTDDVRPLSLSDGSMVWLEPGSELRYPVAFEAEKREVLLDGEAFFEVSKNARQPFYVKTHNLITRVVGTSFLVRTLEENKGTLVQVRTGKVLVYRAESGAGKEEPVAVEANQQLRFSGDPAVLLTEPVSQPSVLSERLDEHHFEFTDVPVPVVLNALSAAYGLSLSYSEADFRNCRITTALTDEPLTEKLNILAETIGAGTRAELDGDRIRLTGAGCP